MYDADVLRYGRDSAWLVSNLQEDKCDGVDGGISMKPDLFLEALEADLFEQRVQIRR